MSGFEYFALFLFVAGLVVVAGAILTLCFEPEATAARKPTDEEVYQSIAQKQQQSRRVRAGPVTEINYVKRGES